MNIFDLSPEDISTLALVISIGLSKQYTEDGQLGTLALLFTCIGDNLALIGFQRSTLAARSTSAESNSSKSNS